MKIALIKLGARKSIDAFTTIFWIPVCDMAWDRNSTRLGSCLAPHGQFDHSWTFIAGFSLGVTWILSAA